LCPCGSASGFVRNIWTKVKDIEPQPLLSTPAVYFQVIHDVKGTVAELDMGNPG